MSRETAKDFKKFEKYISNYKLKKLLKDDNVRKEVKKLHKLYFSLLTFIAELKNYIDDDQHENVVSKQQFTYLAEASSDIATCIFHDINGSYKSSKMMIRSSIETFLKGFCYDELPNLINEKSVYKIFDDVKSLEYFKQENQLKSYEVLHHAYIELCKDTHTAKEVNMQKITALKYFPTFDKTKSEEIYGIY